MNSDVAKTKGTGLWARALDGDSAALESLAEKYWYPAYVWLRVAGNNSSDTTIQIRSFFALLQTKPPIATEPSSARLRDLMLSRLKDFAAQGFPSAEAMPTFLMDVTNAERRFQQEPTRSEDDLFARRWSLTVLENTITTLKQDYALQEKAELFQALKPFLGFNKGEEAGYAEAARAVGLSSSAFHMAAYHFRMRYREVLRMIISDTVRFQEDVDSELTVLLVGAS